VQFHKISDPFSHNWTNPEDQRESAAILLIFESTTDPKILFMRRSTMIRSHAGQISFPGGRREVSDPNPLTTALRECEEEIGLSQKAIEPLGFSPSTRGNDGSWIHVLVARTQQEAKNLNFNDEVEKIHFVPWEFLQRERSIDFSFMLFGNRRKSKLFETPECRVWGLTAKMIFDANLQDD